MSSFLKAQGYEEASYVSLQKDGKFELRKYAPHLVAEVDCKGSGKNGANNAFMTLFNYIGGKNTGSQKVAMTVPVVKKDNELPETKIAMTVPVIKKATEAESEVMQFVMPAKYTMADLPTPNNKAVRIKEVPEKIMASIRFSGTGRMSEMKKEEEKLRQYIKSRGWTIKPVPVEHAYYNAPFIPPFLRRNEVLLELEPSGLPTK
ncbi:MAG: heme-binding protein [Cyanobacteria bacterium SZAS TMP-1]|nr:heme-binding protein [Cyanobacteria bacterium SZAS TMP-1]